MGDARRIRGTENHREYFVLTQDADGLRATGLVAADLTATYTIAGDAEVSFALSDLATPASAYSSGGIKEVSATDAPGLYRLDVPNAAYNTTRDSVVVTLQGAAIHSESEEYWLGGDTDGSLATLNTTTSETQDAVNDLAADIADGVSGTISVHRNPDSIVEDPAGVFTYTYPDGTVRRDNGNQATY